MRKVAIVQARMGSTRLPGKVMKPLCGISVLGHILLRLRRSQRLDDIVVATSTLSRDDVVAVEARRHGAQVCRGSETDVLARYRQAAEQAGADWVVRITADCPLIDPLLLDSMLEDLQERLGCGERIGFFTNTQPHSYPRGLDVEIFPRWALEQACAEASETYQREHVTPFIIEHGERYPLVNVKACRDTSHLRWTLDTPEDFQFFQTIYEALYRDGDIITTAQVMDLLVRQPEISAINAHVQQKEGRLAS